MRGRIALLKRFARNFDEAWIRCAKLWECPARSSFAQRCGRGGASSRRFGDAAPFGTVEISVTCTHDDSPPPTALCLLIATVVLCKSPIAIACLYCSADPMKKKQSPRRLIGDSNRLTMKKDEDRPGSRTRLANRSQARNGRHARNGNGSRNNVPRTYPSSHELAREAAIQRYEELYDFAPTGYVSFDRSGRIAEINLTAARLFGLSRHHLLGMPFAVLVWREDTSIFLHHLLRCRSQEKHVETELRLKDKDRKIIYAQLCSIPTTASESDGAMLFQNSIVDLTAHKKAEAVIQEKEAELELIVTQTPFMLTRCTRDLRYRYVSRAYADLMGRKQEQMAGKPIVEVLGRYGLAKIRPFVERVLSGETVSYEMLIPAKNGQHFLSATYVPDKNDSGEVIGWFASILDVTERKRAEERFRMAVEASPSGMVMVDQDRNIMLVNS